MFKVAVMVESFSIGGAQRVVCELVKNIDQTKIDLLVICTLSRKATLMAEEVEKLAKVVYLNTDKMPFVKRVKTVFKCLSEFKPQIINTHLTPQLYAVPWGILHKTPVIITAHTKPEKAFVKKIEPLIRWGVAHKNTSIVAVSQENLQLMHSYMPSSKGRSKYINNGIAIDQFYRVEHPKFTYINVARQDENKNQAAILRCFAKLYQENKEIRLVLLGDGPCHEQLCELSEELGVQHVVDLPGTVGDVAKYYAEADVYVQASHREAMPMSVLEAMAAGLPVVSSDVGGLRDVVADNGYLYPDDQETALFECMKRMLTMDAHKMECMSEASLRRVIPYSSKAMAENYMRLFADTVREQ